ncbi:trigger factor [Candidatus Peregrinibacteria bacterium]|nr:trigger factor [Candidatus Peregrinibacteria bacterium]MBI3816732.1 trigger factor [Candidatus Peregrinibacteria bacterium]
MPTTTPAKKLSPSRHQFTVAFGAEETKQAEGQALKKVASDLRVPGFRPGHAPAEMVRERIKPEAILEETIRSLLTKTFTSLMEEHKLHPILPPRIDITSREPLVLQIIVVERPVVTLKGLEKIRIEKRDVKIEQKDMDRMIRYVQEQHRTTKDVARKAKHGDQVTLDFVGMDKEGKEIAGTRSSGYAVVIGSKTLIPGFEEALVDLGTEDRKTFTLTFPEKYHAEHLRNQPVTFDVLVKKVEEVNLPELTDAFVKEHGFAQSAGEWKKNIEQTLRAEEERVERQRRESALLEAIRKATVIEIAPELIDQEVRNLIRELGEQLEKQGLTVEHWLTQTKRTSETFEKELRAESTKRIQLRYGIEKILEEKKIAVTDEEMKQAVDGVIRASPPENRKKLGAELVPGSDRYEQLKWQKTIEKMVEGMLG